MDVTPSGGTAATFQKQILNFIDQTLEDSILLVFYIQILT